MTHQPEPDSEEIGGMAETENRIGEADLEPELTDEERRSLASDDEGAGQNSDWLPQ